MLLCQTQPRKRPELPTDFSRLVENDAAPRAVLAPVSSNFSSNAEPPPPTHETRQP